MWNCYNGVVPEQCSQGLNITEQFTAQRAGGQAWAGSRRALFLDQLFTIQPVPRAGKPEPLSAPRDNPLQRAEHDADPEWPGMLSSS